MRLPVIQGIIKRRILANYRVEPAAMQRLLPPVFRPRLHEGWAIAGICLIRLKQIRPAGLPAMLGISSENAAHRVAVEWDGADGEVQQGVYIPRRDTDSRLNHLAGGRVFPGEHHLAEFVVTERGPELELRMTSRDGSTSVRLRGRESSGAGDFPKSSCFGKLEASSAFFECGCVGYSATNEGTRLDGLRLETECWRVQTLAIEEIESSYFDDRAQFPVGTAVFDHALIMRDVPHRWVQEADLATGVVVGWGKLGNATLLSGPGGKRGVHPGT